MKSKAAIGNHPIHPAMVVVPIGAWFAAFVGDIAYANTHGAFWYQFSYYTLMIGTIGALVAAIFGFVDFFGVKMSEAGYRLAKYHMALNLSAVVLYAVNLWLRYNDNAMVDINSGRWTLAFALQVLTFLGVLVSGWIGGSMSYEHKVGVVENYDTEADQIGESELPEGRLTPTRTRGLQG